MTNAIRGEVSVMLDGQNYTLCLTLGALAELETSLGVSGLAGLAARFSEGEIATRDLIALLTAGLRGGGYPYSLDEVAHMQMDGGIQAISETLLLLLQRAFGSQQQTRGEAMPGK